MKPPQPLPRRNLKPAASSQAFDRMPMKPKPVLPRNKSMIRESVHSFGGRPKPPSVTKAVQSPTLKENDTWGTAASAFNQQHRGANSVMKDNINRHSSGSNAGYYFPVRQTAGHFAVPVVGFHDMDMRSMNDEDGGDDRMRRTNVGFYAENMLKPLPRPSHMYHEKEDTLEREISGSNSMLQHSASTSNIQSAMQFADSQWRMINQIHFEKTMEQDKANTFTEIDREKVSAGGDSFKKGGRVRRPRSKKKWRLKSESGQQEEGGTTTRMVEIEKLLLEFVENQEKQAAVLKQTVEEWKELIKQDVTELLRQMKEEQEHERLKLKDEWEDMRMERKKWEEWRKDLERLGKDLEDETDHQEDGRRHALLVNGVENQKGETSMMMIMMTKVKAVNDVLEEKLKKNILKLLAEHKVSSYEKAEIAAKLLQLKFDESDAVEAACECSTVELAIRYLQQKCEVCFELYPMSKMVVMLNCDHQCCRVCAEEYFKTQIRNRNVVDIQCPVCNPLNSIDDEEVLNDYFARLDILLRDMVSAEVHELFQQKLRDWTFEKLGNVKWCAQCKNGYGINKQNEKTLTCPHCNFVICAICECKWEKQHDGISCEQYAKWKQENDPDFQAEGLEKHLAKHGIKCPKCNFQYSLAKGGCMHFNCLQCKFGFCSGCGQPFRIGGKCNVSIYCENYGLHAHHPRNCLFYLRDKDPDALRKLLDDSCVPYDTETAQNDKCLVNIQVETVNGFADGHCGKKVGEMYAGLCRLHYVEYLVDMINRNSIDPIATFDKDELAMEFRRHEMEVPGMASQETDVAYCARLRQVIMEEIPLEDVCSPTQA